MHTIPHTVNDFAGVVTDPEGLPASPEAFEDRLAHSLAEWSQQGYRAVWLEIPIERAALVPVAVRAGFAYHHAEESYALLTLRLVEGTYIPPHASHYVGAGGVVLNEARELLVVSELYHSRRRSRPFYKLPGGAVRAGEHVADGVMREVLEETGIRTKFESMVCFRQWHGYRFGKSDIYFVCRLTPLNTDIHKQDDEIDECLWMPVDKYLASEYVWGFNKSVVSAALADSGMVRAALGGNNDASRFEWFMPRGAPETASPQRDHVRLARTRAQAG